LARDPYQELGVSRGASADEIRKAFRKLAKANHPDTNPGNKEAEERFKRVSGAFDILGDTDKRKKFDAGEIDADGRETARGFAGGGPWGAHPGGGFGGGGRYESQSFEGVDLGDILGEMFGGARGRGGGQGGGFGGFSQRGSDVRAKLEIDLEDAIRGGKKRIAFSDGRTIDVTIPKGAQEGQTLRLKGQGAASPGGGPSGDLHLEIRVRPHPQFTRKDNDIYAELPVTLGEAVLGGRIEVPTVDGTVSMTVPKGANTGTRLRVRGKGAPPPGGGPRGDHYVALKVMLPPSPDDELVRFVEEWSPKHPYRVR